MLSLHFRLFQRRKDESTHLPEDLSEPISTDLTQPHSETLDPENQTDLENQTYQNKTHLQAHIQEVRSNYLLERRIFW